MDKNSKKIKETKFTKEELIHYIKIFSQYYNMDEDLFLHKMIEISFDTISPLFDMVNPIEESIIFDTENEDMLVCYRKNDEDKIKFGYIKEGSLVKKELPDTLFDLFKGTYRQTEIYHNGKLINIEKKRGKVGRPPKKNKIDNIGDDEDNE